MVKYRISCMLHVLHVGEMRNVTVLLERLKGIAHLEVLCIGRWMILKWMSGKQGESIWTGFRWLNTGTSGRLL
jgi:hypothetical protein